MLIVTPKYWLRATLCSLGAILVFSLRGRTLRGCNHGRVAYDFCRGSAYRFNNTLLCSAGGCRPRWSAGSMLGLFTVNLEYTKVYVINQLYVMRIVTFVAFHIVSHVCLSKYH